MDTLIWGGTGQAKIIRPIIEHGGHRIVAVYDRNATVPPPFADIPLLSAQPDLDALFAGYQSDPLAFAVAIGGRHGEERTDIGESLRRRGFEALTLVHEKAWVAPTARLGVGCQILAMAAVSEEAEFGRYCIVNTNASVDHECRLGDGVHVMPGATIAGCVEIGAHATIGSNATVLPRVCIGEGAMVGAGGVVSEDVAAHTTVVGIPARPLRDEKTDG